MAVEATSKRCPRCSLRISKYVGCNHVKCKFCSLERSQKPRASPSQLLSIIHRYRLPSLTCRRLTASGAGTCGLEWCYACLGTWTESETSNIPYCLHHEGCPELNENPFGSNLPAEWSAMADTPGRRPESVRQWYYERTRIRRSGTTPSTVTRPRIQARPYHERPAAPSDGHGHRAAPQRRNPVPAFRQPVNLRRSSWRSGVSAQPGPAWLTPSTSDQARETDDVHPYGRQSQGWTHLVDTDPPELPATGHTDLYPQLHPSTIWPPRARTPDEASGPQHFLGQQIYHGGKEPAAVDPARWLGRSRNASRAGAESRWGAPVGGAPGASPTEENGGFRPPTRPHVNVPVWRPGVQRGFRYD
jgi:hypothetical protein